MIDRKEILAEAKKHGLTCSGHDIIDLDNGLAINTAFFISKVRKLSQISEFEESVKSIILGCQACTDTTECEDSFYCRRC